MIPAHRATQPSHERLIIDGAAASRFDAVRQWSATRIAQAHRVGAIPLAGSPAWCALDETDLRKTAAVLHAALAWLHESTPAVITDRLRAELDLIDRCHAERMTAIACDVSGATDWAAMATGPTLRELTRRRTTYQCPGCRALLRFTDTRCVRCGWVEPTPQQRRETARCSWADVDNVPETEVAA